MQMPGTSLGVGIGERNYPVRKKPFADILSQNGSNCTRIPPTRASTTSHDPAEHRINSPLKRPDCQSEPELKTGFWEGRVFWRITGHGFKNMLKSSFFPDMKDNSGPKKCLFIAFLMGDRIFIRTPDRPENRLWGFGDPQNRPSFRFPLHRVDPKNDRPSKSG